MEPPAPPARFTILILSLILSVVGWLGFILVIVFTLPTLFPRWLFFFFLCMGLTGLALPVVNFFNRRFPSDPPPGGSVIIRQAMWFGVYGSLLAWLQMGRVLTSTTALFIAAGFTIIEVFIRMAEISRWKPKETKPDE